ncbi:protein MFI isoform X2 [Castor canadensis]|uniref:Protein MFI isoform X2 n=1 Tax=Castor canadensis TaxID=51338 RepID=A0AC58M0H5_CASCN
MSKEEEPELKKQDIAARIIQRSWKCFLAELLDAAAGIHIRFRLGGVKFPPDIYYKIFTQRPIEDLCANSPRDYTKLPAKRTSHNKSNPPHEEDHSSWYRRVENNGWRPVCDRIYFYFETRPVSKARFCLVLGRIHTQYTDYGMLCAYMFWIPTDNKVVESKKETEFHFSKLKRRQDLEKKRKIRKIEWMRQMYYAGSLEAKATHPETLGLIHTATKGLIKSIEEGGVDSVMEWEVDEVLKWTNTLNFDEYITTWKRTATSNSSANLNGFRFGQAQKDTFNYEDVSEMQMEAPYDAFYEDVYRKPTVTRLTPDSTYRI